MKDVADILKSDVSPPQVRNIQFNIREAEMQKTSTKQYSKF